MEKDTIQSHVSRLPEIPFGVVPENGEIWEADDGAAHVKVTRHVLRTLDAYQLVSLTVSGPPDERRRVLRDFKAAYGTPAGGQYDFQSDFHIDVFQWLIARPLDK